MMYADEVLRQQLKDLCREALPNLAWVDNIQGSSVELGSLKLSLIAGGGVRDSCVWLTLGSIDNDRDLYHRTLRRGRGVEAAQGGRDPNRPVGNDPFTFLRECLQEAYEISLESA